MRINPKITIPNIKIDNHPPMAEPVNSNAFCPVKSDVMDGIPMQRPELLKELLLAPPRQ